MCLFNLQTYAASIKSKNRRLTSQMYSAALNGNVEAVMAALQAGSCHIDAVDEVSSTIYYIFAVMAALRAGKCHIIKITFITLLCNIAMYFFININNK